MAHSPQGVPIEDPSHLVVIDEEETRHRTRGLAPRSQRC
ncbi:hypothetical protein D187_006863 [Cystobacter fuscus DSM 2262]|uniref:Uncharacterized protein n=1 Tax=Cystobacter fuscus (strain ATCC 25194 / DSM 2262 / NBRC 100088 / M29) TaxID=1242864 RepID=S9Q739_CYSF2|nr:hypothetical protein D187_006863 [Cystobacter fuscus DSM 2262]